MQITLKGRQCGKTHDMVRKVMAVGEDAIMVVFSKEEKDRIIKVYKMNYPNIGDRVLTFSDRKELIKEHPSTWNLYVDNADIILQMLLGWGISEITMTKGKEDV